MNPQDLQKTAALLHKNWGLDAINVDSESALLAALKIQMQFLLENDFERLVQTMYRLDVSENKFLAAINLHTVEEKAEHLAKLVYQRELQRIAIWNKYSNPKN